MKRNILYHNPRCSKSRGALKILQDKGMDVEVVEYLKDAPSVEDLQWICQQLSISPKGLIRRGEQAFKDLGLSLEDERSDDEWVALLTKHPELIQRPILVYNGKAAIGRPPEKILDIL